MEVAEQSRLFESTVQLKFPGICEGLTIRSVHPCWRSCIHSHLGALPILIDAAIVVLVYMQIEAENVVSKLAICDCGDMFHMVATVRDLVSRLPQELVDNIIGLTVVGEPHLCADSAQHKGLNHKDQNHNSLKKC